MTPNDLQIPLYLNIHFMADPDEHVTLLVSGSITLDKILKFLCNKPYWESEDSKRKTFFGSFGRTPSGVTGLKNKPKFVDRTKEFHSKLLGLLSLLGYPPQETQATPPSFMRGGKGLTSAQLSLISFAKKTIGESGLPIFSPLTVSTQTTVSQCFSQSETKQSSAENPLSVYIYLSTTAYLNPSTSSMAKQFPNKTIFFSKQILSYITSIVMKESGEDISTSKNMVIDLLRTAFHALMEILPYSGKASYQAFEESLIPSIPLVIHVQC